MKRRVRLFQVLEEAARWQRTALLPQCPVREMLAIVRRKMDAETAALVLIDVRSCRLMTSAAAGDTDERLDRSVRLIEGEMRAGQGAAVTGGDIRSIDLEVATKLRARGLRSLLAVRLTAGRARGTLYIALRGNRAFTGAEVARLKMLTAILASHLDKAQRRAAPQNRVDDLAKELVATLLNGGDRGPLLGAAATAAPKRRARCRRPRPRSGRRMR